MKRKKIIQNKFTVAVGAFLSLFTIMSGSKLFSLFFSEFERNGIPMSTISVASVVATVTVFLSGTYIHKIIGKMGLKCTMLLGSILMAAAYALFSTANTFFVFLGFAMLGTGTSFCGYTPASLLISNWYGEKKGLVLSIVFTGMTLGTAAYSYLCGIFFTKYGLKITSIIVCGIMLLISLPSILLLVEERPVKRSETDESGREEKDKTDIRKTLVLDIDAKSAGKSSLFLLILLFCLLTSGIVTTVQSYLPAHLQNEGMSTMAASGKYSLMMLAGTFGTLLGGYLADKRGTRFFQIYTMTVFWAATWLLIFFPLNSSIMALAAVLMGIAYPVGTLSPTLLMSGAFGERAYTSLLGIVHASVFVSMGIFFPAAGFIYRIQGTYRNVMIALNLMVIAVIFLSVIITSDKVKQKMIEKYQ